MLGDRPPGAWRGSTGEAQLSFFLTLGSGLGTLGGRSSSSGMWKYPHRLTEMCPLRSYQIQSSWIYILITGILNLFTIHFWFPEKLEIFFPNPKLRMSFRICLLISTDNRLKGSLKLHWVSWWIWRKPSQCLIFRPWVRHISLLLR